jgi:hypothetical protein
MRADPSDVFRSDTPKSRRKVSPDFGGLRILPYYCSVAGQTALKGQETVASPFPAAANFVSRALLPQNRG